LTALRVRQAGEVEDYFQRTQTEVLSLSEFPVVPEAFKALKAGYDQLNSPESPAPQGDKKLEEICDEIIEKKLCKLLVLKLPYNYDLAELKFHDLKMVVLNKIIIITIAISVIV
jgi:hypothetical protein